MSSASVSRNDQDLSGGLVPSRLREALEKNELALFCQPIMAFSGDTTFPMAEVLIRLREEEKALLPPGDFLPVFEHYRMMPALDRWVVRQVMRQFAEGSPIPCYTINIASQTIDDENFSAFLATETQNAPAGSVVLELDESDLIARPAAVMRLAAAAKSIGVGVAVDSFGRESASFDLVEKLAPSHVKVDGAIIRKLLSSEVAQIKLSAVLRVGETVPFSVIAECVETDDVMRRLKSMGVGFAQGLGVHKPQPLEAAAV